MSEEKKQIENHNSDVDVEEEDSIENKMQLYPVRATHTFNDLVHDRVNTTNNLEDSDSTS
jgi:hypothetical protein